MIPWFSEMVTWLALFGYFWQDSTHPQSASQWGSPESTSHHSSSSNMICSRCLLLHGPMMSQQLSFRHDLPSQLQRHHNPDSKASKTKKQQVNEIFLQIHTPVVSNICRVQWFGLRTPSATQSTPHKQGILQVHVSETDGLSLEFTWLSAQPFAGNVSLDQLQLVDLWEQRNPSIFVNGRTSPKQCHTVEKITQIQHGSPKSQPHVSSKKSGPNKKDIWRKQTFLQRTWEPHLVLKKNDLWTSHFHPKKYPLYPQKPRRTPRDRIRIAGRETTDDGTIRNHLAIYGKPWHLSTQG